MRICFTILTIFFLSICANSIFAQAGKITIKGIVTDKANHQPKGGVSILGGKPLKGIGVTADDGTFTAQVLPGTELVFKYAGYDDVIKKVSVSTMDLEVIIASKPSDLQEVVVQGFKQRLRATQTGSSTIITAKQIQDVPVSNVMELLQGKVAGLNVQNNSGAPGAMGTVQLRGLSNVGIAGGGVLTPTTPLIVIDGVPIDPNSNAEYGASQGGPGTSPLALIPVEDIQQIEVLKDASSTAVYGSRGAYGVILITTKRGQSKIPIVLYTSSFFVNMAPKLRPTLGGKEERAVRINQILQYDTTLSAAMALINATPMLSDSLNPYYNNSTNWQKQFFRNTYNQTHNINISGGDQKFSYKADVGYYQENGILIGTGFRRFSLNMNALYQPSDRFRMLASVLTSTGLKNNGSGMGLFQQGLSDNSNVSSLLPPPSIYSTNNAALQAAAVKESNKSNSFQASLDLQWEPIKNIRFGDVFSYSYLSNTSDKFTPSVFGATLYGTTFIPNASTSYSYNDYTPSMNNRVSATYYNTFQDKHNVMGYLFDEITSTSFKASAMQLIQSPNDAITGPIGFGSANSRGGTLDNVKDTRTHGYGGGFSYDYMKKYVINLDMRFDATTTNGPSNGYTKNPSIGLRWNFSKEAWFSKWSWLDYASIRGSWGRSIIPTGTIFDVYGKYTQGNQYNNAPTIGINFGAAPNNALKPMTTTQTNVGFEWSILNSKISGVFEVYYKTVDNQLDTVPVANVNGFSSVLSNSTSLANTGVEWTLSYRPLSSSVWKWTVGVTGSYIKNVLTHLPDGIRQLAVNFTDADGTSVPIIKRLGRSAFTNQMYYTKGVYATDADVPVNPATGQRLRIGNTYFKAGDPAWADINGDYIIDQNDFVIAGDPQPKVTGGIFSYLSYKQWSLNVNASYTLIRDIINLPLAKKFQAYYAPTANSALLPLDQYSYWSPNHTNAQYPNPLDFTRSSAIDPFRSNQTLFQEDGSYWKINNITLSYQLDRNVTKRWGINSSRVYFTMNNVHTFSKYSGADPENVTSLGRDQSNGYPMRRSYVLGINVQF